MIGWNAGTIPNAFILRTFARANLGYRKKKGMEENRESMRNKTKGKN